MNKTLLFSWTIAVIATLGSLTFSEALNFIPCTLCWYQRILMYPLAIILGIAFYRSDREIYRYTLPLSILGIVISGYHIALQKIPSLTQFEVCKSGVPCSKDYLNLFGFITIPMMAFTAFVIITICMILLTKQNTNDTY